MRPRTLKRIVVAVVILATAAGLAFGAGQADNKPEAARPAPSAAPAAAPAATQGKYGEAPMLRDLVQKGTLPKVEDRLPKEPLVMPVEKQIGQYGGTWRRAFYGTNQTRPLETVTHEPLVWRVSHENLRIAPNIAKSWKWSEDGKTITFSLRPGMKWSDGQPFTAQDIKFWWEDVVLYRVNPTEKVVVPTWLLVGGKPAVFAFIDDYTFSITFPVHHAFFLEVAAESSAAMMIPAHYGRQFHPKYTEPAKHGLKTKEELYNLLFDKVGDFGNRYWNPERPVVDAWMTTKWEVGKTHVMERNPYYFKVDPKGNQLPYVDRIDHTMVQNVELLNLRVVTGQVDMQLDHLSFDNYAIFVENEKRGDYKVGMWLSDRTAVPVIGFNFTHKDPVLRKIMWEKDFRRALSYAINREEINEKVWFGRARPMSPCIYAKSPWFTEGLDKLHIQYDPALSNKLLDGIGLTKKDAQGFRLRPDGKRLTLRVTMEWPPPWAEHVPALELIREEWAAVGVELILDPVAANLRNIRLNNSEQDLATHNRGGTVTPWAQPDYWVPAYLSNERYAPMFSKYYMTGGKEGEPPTGMFADAVKDWEAIRVELNEEKRDAMIKKFVWRPIEELWYLGTVGETPELIVKKNNFMNVPERAVLSWRLRVEAIGHPEQFFFKQ